MRVKVPEADIKYIRNFVLDTMKDKAAVPGVNRNDIHREPLTMPPTEVQVGFESLVAPLMAKTRANREEGDILAATRDLLLPKLMSGEIRLRDAEAMAEAVL